MNTRRTRSTLTASLTLCVLAPLMVGPAHAGEFISSRDAQILRDGRPASAVRVGPDAGTVIAVAGLAAAAVVLLGQQERTPAYVVATPPHCATRYVPARHTHARPAYRPARAAAYGPAYSPTYGPTYGQVWQPVLLPAPSLRQY